ncbi:DEAD/DEAH box helicase [Thermosulfuriphilus sp.]
MEVEARSRLLLEPVGRPFDDFPLDESLKSNLKKSGFLRTTVFQDFCLPHLLEEGEDLLVEAPRGSGKATAYLLALIQHLLKEGGIAIVLVASEARALALLKEAEKLAQGTGLLLAFFGGPKEELSQQMRRLEAGVHLLLTTPAWLKKIFKWRLLDPLAVKALVIDEPEAMLDDLAGLIGRLPKVKTMVFLSQVSYEAVALAHRFLKDPLELFWGRRRPGVQGLRLRLYHVSQKEKFALLLNLLKEERGQRVVIFAANELVAKALAGDLQRRGYRTFVLLPDLGPQRRLEIIRQFNSQRTAVLVTTDASSAYMELLKTKFIINYDLPTSGEEFLLRIGALAVGSLVISLCDETGAFSLEEIEASLGRKMKIASVFPKEGRRRSRASSTFPRRQGHLDNRPLSA